MKSEKGSVDLGVALVLFGLMIILIAIVIIYNMYIDATHCFDCNQFGTPFPTMEWIPTIPFPTVLP